MVGAASGLEIGEDGSDRSSRRARMVKAVPVGEETTVDERAELADSLPRRFRPDVEGLRAIAVVLVVLYHACVPGVRGGEQRSRHVAPMQRG